MTDDATPLDRFRDAQCMKAARRETAERIAALESEKADLLARLKRMHVALLNAGNREHRAKEALSLERQRSRLLKADLDRIKGRDFLSRPTSSEAA